MKSKRTEARAKGSAPLRKAKNDPSGGAGEAARAAVDAACRALVSAERHAADHDGHVETVYAAIERARPQQLGRQRFQRQSCAPGERSRAPRLRAVAARLREVAPAPRQLAAAPQERFGGRSAFVEMVQINRKNSWTRAGGLSFTVGWWKESVSVFGQSSQGSFSDASVSPAPWVGAARLAWAEVSTPPVLPSRSGDVQPRRRRTVAPPRLARATPRRATACAFKDNGLDVERTVL
jgi:hypothetical protein